MGKTVVVCLNMSAQQQTVSLGLGPAGLHGSRLRTLLSSPAPHPAGVAADRQVLAPYAAWIAELR
jgi:hypothetical protein